MKTKIKIEKEINLKTLIVNAKVRYWEDAEVNGWEDKNGDLIPCRAGDEWNPIIDIDNGVITNWEEGKIADIHYKVCDLCGWALLDDNGNIVLSSSDGYVPKTLCPSENGYGDYIIMHVNENGLIKNWEFNINDFTLES